MIETVDIPKSFDKWREIRQALLAAPVGKCVRVDLDTFGNCKPQTVMKMENFGRKMHTRNLSDGWYLWLDPIEPEAAGAE